MDLLLPGWFIQSLVVLSIIAFVLMLVALVSVLKNNQTDSVTKLIWVIVIIFVPAIGAILYFLIGRKQKNKNILARD